MHANRLIALLFFWLTPLVTFLALAGISTLVFDAYDPAYGRDASFGISAAVAVCPSSMNTVAFAFVLASFPPIAARHSRRLFVLSASLSVVSYVLGVLLSTWAFNALGDETALFLLIPPLVTAALSCAACLGSRTGLLPEIGAGGRTCPKCGYDLRATETAMESTSTPARCPECGCQPPTKSDTG